jgi:hypothetical protein
MSEQERIAHGVLPPFSFERPLTDSRNIILEAELERVTAQLTAVDKHLGPWEPEPGSDVGCVGRVQTILNLKADRGELESVTAALRDDLTVATEALKWIMEFSEKMIDSHPGFVHTERHARTALVALAGGARAAQEDEWACVCPMTRPDYRLRVERGSHHTPQCAKYEPATRKAKVWGPERMRHDPEDK